MAEVSISNFDWNRDYYAFVRIDGYACYSGRFRAWKLYSLTSNAVKTLSQRHEEVLAMFETQEELETYLQNKYTQEASQSTEAFKPKTIGTEGGDKLIISSIL